MGVLQRKRVYEDPQPSDGVRVLVDRLWPRGVSKERAAIDLWAKQIAPSPELRKAWHAADASEWASYAAQYAVELDNNPDVADVAEQLRDADTITLVYAAHDPEHNHVVILEPVLAAALAAARNSA